MSYNHSTHSKLPNLFPTHFHNKLVNLQCLIKRKSLFSLSNVKEMLRENRALCIGSSQRLKNGRMLEKCERN